MKSVLLIPAGIFLLLTACVSQTSLAPNGQPAAAGAGATSRLAAPPLHPKLITGAGGNSTLRSNNKTLLINASVSFANNENDITNYHWNVPLSIDTIIIRNGVTVTGGFRISSNDNIFIKGESPTGSVLFGTALKNWAVGPDGLPDTPDDRLPQADKPQYSTITEAPGATGITARVENLQVKNARLYAVTFRGTNKLLAKRVYVLNTRATGGSDYQSNSDGFVGGDNSVIDDCYIDTWDDAIKLYYNNCTVKNTTIVHNKNGAPFQLGWSNKSAVTATLQNIKVIDAIGANNSNQSLFCFAASQGTCDVTINISRFQAPTYSASANLNLGGTNRTPLPLVGFKSTTSGSKIKFIGTNGQDFFGSAAVGFYSSASATAKTDRVCSASTNVNVGSAYSCGAATGCSWKQ